MKYFLLALQFLTVFPVDTHEKPSHKDFGRALAYFPVVGLCIGLLLVLVLLVFNFLPQAVIAALLLIVCAAITGGLHLDGFIDTCDGLGAGKTPEESLEIMHSSTTGAIGVVAIVLLLILKYTIFISIPDNVLWKLLILMVVFARWIQVWTCFFSKYVREDGKAKHFVEQAAKEEVKTGLIFTVCAFVLLLGIKGLVLFFVSLMPVYVFVNWIEKKIGGMTGDTIGAVSEAAEISLLLFGLMLVG
ncbi:MAG: adenosylcobinamide-GDP ribazoletransferase [Candidatus Omnitrophota bacterium]